VRGPNLVGSCTSVGKLVLSTFLDAATIPLGYTAVSSLDSRAPRLLSKPARLPVGWPPPGVGSKVVDRLKIGVAA
jgi:hypothetical protein